MSLIRCARLLNRKECSLSHVFKQITVFYSDEKNSSDDGDQSNKSDNKKAADKKGAKQTKSASKSISTESQAKLNDLLKKLSARSTLGIVKEVQGAKPIGYRKLRQTQNLDAKETKPRNIKDAAKAVSQELGDEKVQDEILSPFEGDQKSPDFLE